MSWWQSRASFEFWRRAGWINSLPCKEEKEEKRRMERSEIERRSQPICLWMTSPSNDLKLFASAVWIFPFFFYFLINYWIFVPFLLNSVASRRPTLSLKQAEIISLYKISMVNCPAHPHENFSKFVFFFFLFYGGLYHRILGELHLTAVSFWRVLISKPGEWSLDL